MQLYFTYKVTHLGAHNKIDQKCEDTKHCIRVRQGGCDDV